jgi:disulfide bond formation protein DsbB
MPDANRESSAVSASVVWLPLAIALVALAGSLYLSMGMRLKACPLCFYQRTFVMAVAAVLGIGLLTGTRHRGVLNLLVLPLSVAGAGVALFHVYVESIGKLECPGGVLGLGTAPQQSLAAMALLLIAALVGIVRGGAGERRMTVSVAGIVVGVLLAWAAVASSPPAPQAPTKPYEAPPDVCRPPFRGT